MASTHRTGTAGQLAVAAVFARRGYNVAIPMIDEGEDLLVRNDHTSKIWSVQVKTATPGVRTTTHQKYQFGLKRTQLRDGPGHLWYALVWPSIDPSGWGYFIMRRDTLERYHRTRGAGSHNASTGKITLNLSVPLDPSSHHHMLSKTLINVDRWIDNFAQWPDIMP